MVTGKQFEKFPKRFVIFIFKKHLHFV